MVDPIRDPVKNARTAANTLAGIIESFGVERFDELDEQGQYQVLYTFYFPQKGREIHWNDEKLFDPLEEVRREVGYVAYSALRGLGQGNMDFYTVPPPDSLKSFTVQPWSPPGSSVNLDSVPNPSLSSR